MGELRTFIKSKGTKIVKLIINNKIPDKKMMNKTLLVFISLLIFSCKNPNSENDKVKSTEVTEKKETKINDTDDCVALVNNFPSNFQEFYRIYGYDDIKGEGDLYSKYEEDINAFFLCSQVSNYVKLRKAINVGINGKWDADAVGLFQHKLIDLIKSNPQESLKILNNISRKEASSFWFFLFEGPHPEDKENKENVNALMELFNKDSTQTLLLKQEYEKFLKQ